MWSGCYTINAIHHWLTIQTAGISSDVPLWQYDAILYTPEQLSAVLELQTS